MRLDDQLAWWLVLVWRWPGRRIGGREGHLPLEYVIVPTGRLGGVGRSGWEREDNMTCSGVGCGVRTCDWVVNGPW